jgi:nitrate/TMAO reductase-like tetraheme cytochrome c subunit
MSEQSANSSDQKMPSLLQNWISLFGMIVAGCSFFAVLCLIIIDFYQSSGNPYMGILTYVVTPSFLVMGLTLIAVGGFLEWRRRHRLAPGEVPRHPRIDFNLPKHRRNFVIIMSITFVFLMFTAFGSYQTYHFTESVTFCGTTCHTVMKPEHTAYQKSPHARVTCTQCHIGSGAGWFVKAKLSGAYQVYSVLADKFPRPIPTPVHNLRPAQDTCEQCHWPQKFSGGLVKVRRHFMSDETNTPWTISLLMKVGGGDPKRGEVEGIHWHVSGGNKIDYISDESRQKIPWVRVTGSDGKVTVYEAKGEKLTPDQIAGSAKRVMDCIDCHNRPSHIYHSPDDAVNAALAGGLIDRTLPLIKKNAVAALVQEVATEAEAMKKISAKLKDDYSKHPDQTKVASAIAAVQGIFRENFFPEMKVNWKAYPSHVGHHEWPGCFRCHDGEHVSPAGGKISADCNSCHTILAQGAGTEPKAISPQGLEFVHPGEAVGDAWKESKCSDCHNGGPM